VFLTMIGRFGVAGVPRRPDARAGHVLALATLTVLLGMIAVVFPVAAAAGARREGLPVVVRNNGVAEWRLMLPATTRASCSARA
jgi:hypothetical protein